jgi:hypothetical protein
MKNFTTLLAAILMTFAVTAFANDEAKIYNGKVVLETGETLVGQIEMLSPTMNEVKVKFIANGQATTYKASEVASYSFTFPRFNPETKTYKEEVVEYVKKTVEIAPVPFGPKTILMEREVAGAISLYNFYLETRAAEHAFDHNYYVEKNGQMIAVTQDNYKAVLQDMVADFPELKAKIGTTGYGYKYIATIIKEYNNFVSPKGEMFGMR